MDEVHDRSLDSDGLLALAKEALRTRRDLVFVDIRFEEHAQGETWWSFQVRAACPSQDASQLDVAKMDEAPPTHPPCPRTPTRAPSGTAAPPTHPPCLRTPTRAPSGTAAPWAQMPEVVRRASLKDGDVHLLVDTVDTFSCENGKWLAQELFPAGMEIIEEWGRPSSMSICKVAGKFGPPGDDLTGVAHGYNKKERQQTAHMALALAAWLRNPMHVRKIMGRWMTPKLEEKLRELSQEAGGGRTLS